MVSIFLFVLAGICLMYYLVIVAYAGIGSSFSFVWLIAAVLLSLAGLAWGYTVRRNGHMPVAVKYIVSAVVIIAAGVFIYVESLIAGAMTRPVSPNMDYLIVLGAHVRGTTITKSLKYRLDAAVDYYNDNRNTIIIVSGGRGNGEDISEAQAMHDYLVAHGVPDENIIMEDKSTNTMENIRFSTALIDNPEEKDIAIVTNNFHVYRAKEVCKMAGYDVETVAAKSDKILFINYMVREFFAVVKYKLVGYIS